MRSRLLAAVLIGGLVALAGPAWSQSRGRGHVGGGRSFGGHVGGGHGFVGHGGPVGRFGGGGHGGGVFHGGGGVFHGGGGIYRGGGGYRGGGVYRGGGRHWGGYHGWGGHSGWRGYYPWAPNLSFPFWWDGAYGWGSPYWSEWPYGNYPYDGYDGYDGYYGGGPDSGPSYGMQGSFGSGYETAPVAGPTRVDLQVSPESALTVLNGVVIGSVDQFEGAGGLYLEAGRYTLEFRAPGYRNKVLNLDIGGQAKTVVSLELPRDPANVAVAPGSPSPGLPYGRTFTPDFGPATAQPHAGPTSPVRGQLLHRSDADSTRPAPTAAPDMGALRLHVVPANAAVYLDGVLLGTGNEFARLQRGIAVTPGPHRIDVVAPGLAGKTLQFDAGAGKEQELSVTLE
ncbi:MAG TPA: hypothetical protein PK435_05520 [Thermoanaerobaculaceae bacterium]|nr:hypothetical protein [Thermoanaerobaculaceae bacterium]